MISGTEPLDDPRMRETVAMLREREPMMAQEVVARIRAELRSYEAVDETVLVDAMRINVERSVSSLASGSSPTTEAAENRAMTRSRLDLGVPIGDIIRAYRIALTVIYDEFVAVADEVGLSAPVLLRGTRLLWQIGDWFVSGAAAEYRYHAARDEVRAALQRSEAVRALVTEGGERPDLARLESIGVDADGVYRVLVSIDPAPTSSERHRPHCRSAAVEADLDGTVYAIVPAAEPLAHEQGAWAAGPPAPLDGLHLSAAQALRVRNAAPDSVTGVVEALDLGWRMLLPLDDVTRQALRRALLEPLHPGTPAGADILATLRTHLAHGRSVRRTAEAMTVHQNTVRYRLERFQALTGKSWDDTGVLVGLALVLADEEKRPS